jgi:hypothetical protein
VEGLRRSKSESGEPQPEAADLVAQLESLADGPEAVVRLVACGREAVGPLREYLLAGRITSLLQPRCWAVEALAALGARDVLLEYLRQERPEPDPVLRLSEDAVESAAARALVAWPSDEVFSVLLERARARMLPGLVEALGAFQRAEAVPVLVRALEDDVCRRAAEDALRTAAPGAVPVLIRNALSPMPEAGDESPSSLLRRRSAVALLTEVYVDAGEWPRLRPLLLEDDHSLVVAAARLAARLAPRHDRRLAASRLIEMVDAGWPLSAGIEDVLAELGPDASDLVEAEIGRGSASPGSPQVFDSGLALLRRALRRAARP